MKKLLSILVFVFVISFNGYSQQETKVKFSSVLTYETYLKLTIQDSSYVLTTICEDKLGDDFWDEVLARQKFENILDIFSYLTKFDFKPVSVEYEEFEDKATILFHRKLEEVWTVICKEK